MPIPDAEDEGVATGFWTPVSGMETIFVSVLSLLSDPNPDDPANAEAAKLFRDSPKEFEKQVAATIAASLREKPDFITLRKDGRLSDYEAPKSPELDHFDVDDMDGCVRPPLHSPFPTLLATVATEGTAAHDPDTLAVTTLTILIVVMTLRTMKTSQSQWRRQPPPPSLGDSKSYLLAVIGGGGLESWTALPNRWRATNSLTGPSNTPHAHVPSPLPPPRGRQGLSPPDAPSLHTHRLSCSPIARPISMRAVHYHNHHPKMTSSYVVSKMAKPCEASAKMPFRTRAIFSRTPRPTLALAGLLSIAAAPPSLACPSVSFSTPTQMYPLLPGPRNR